MQGSICYVGDMSQRPEPPRIIFEDTHLLVLDKPPGWLSQDDASGEMSLVGWLQQYLGRPYVGLVHRLDRNTSGLMVVGKRTKSARRLTEALQKGLLKRQYQALLVGKLVRPTDWAHFLVKDEATNKVTVYRKSPGPEAKTASLTVRPLTTAFVQDVPVTLAEFELQTGRSHQIRAQAAFEGLALLGDTKYSTADSRKLSHLLERPALHSFHLSFPHPMTGEVQSFSLALPNDMKQVLEVKTGASR